MTTKRVRADELNQYIGRWITYTFSDGWEDWTEAGYLQGTERLGERIFIYLSDEPELPDYVDSPSGLGGGSLRPDGFAHVTLG